MSSYEPPTKVPRRLILVDGELVLADGGDVRQYLRDFAAYWKISADEPITLTTADEYDRLYQRALIGIPA